MAKVYVSGMEEAVERAVRIKASGSIVELFVLFSAAVWLCLYLFRRRSL